MNFARLITFVALVTIPLQTLQAEESPEPQSLIARAIKAIGGSKALAKTRITIIEDEGTFYGMGDGLPYKGRHVMVHENPGRHRMEILEQFIAVTDRDKAWIAFMGLTIDAEGEALDVAKQASLIRYATSLIPLEKPGKEFTLSPAKAVTVDDEKCAGIKIDHKSMPTVTMHFSPKTGLIKRIEHKSKVQEMGFKEVTDQTIFHEYKEIDGVMSAVKMTIFRDGKKYVESKPTKISFPKELDDSEFKKPEK